MAISYDKLLEIMTTNEITDADLMRRANLAAGTISRIRKGQPIPMSSIERICRAMYCSPDDILAFVPDGEETRRRILPRNMPILMDRLRNHYACARTRRAHPAAPKVSIILPVYNVSRYLAACVKSVLVQTMTEIEIICINDGSTDGSADILRRFAEQDSRIILLHQANRGYGASVNRGLDIARGEYVSIVETDDFIEPQMMQALYDVACAQGKPDIVKSSYHLYYDDTDEAECRKRPPIAIHCNPPEPVFSIRTYPELIYHHPSIWSCLYRRGFLEAHAIRFVEAKGAGWVDNPFFLQTMWQAERIAWTPDAYYNYRQTNPGASSFVKDCRIPFQRLSEMIRFADHHRIDHPDVLGSLYKRMLWNLAMVVSNPHYQPERDDPLILPVLRRLDVTFLANKRVTNNERTVCRAYCESHGLPIP
ncbi:MAG: glycosyltransferase [Clostridia bacterium]|nr:glycosyltransferase [Clostridia bacterium]